MTVHQSSTFCIITILISLSPCAAHSVCSGVPLSPLARYHPCAVCIVSRETWRSACSLFAIDRQSVQRFIIFACVTEEEDDGMRKGVSCKNFSTGHFRKGF